MASAKANANEFNRRAQNGKGEVTLGMNPYGHAITKWCDSDRRSVRAADFGDHELALPWGSVGPKNYLITGDWPGAASAYVEKSFGEILLRPLPLVLPVILIRFTVLISILKATIPMLLEGCHRGGLRQGILRVAKELKTFSSASISVRNGLYHCRQK